MALEDWEALGDRRLVGGQGSVVQVRHRIDGRIGALKQLHSDLANDRESRFRFQREAETMRFLAGRGVPELFDSNVNEWESADVELFTVVRWVEGKKLSDHVGGKPVAPAEAVAITQILARTLAECHTAGVQHRDIKPDNIIVADGDDPLTAFLVDFGLAWSPDEAVEFETSLGRELGNRFLRLPELAPGHRARDDRSDVTQLVGVLIFLLAGTSPRVLLDANGLAPHEFMADRFPPATTSDAVWPALKRVLQRGLRQNIDDRFQSAAEFLEALSQLFRQPSVKPTLPAAVARFREAAGADPLQPIRRATEFLTAVLDNAGKKVVEGHVDLGGPTVSLGELRPASVEKHGAVQQYVFAYSGHAPVTLEVTHGIRLTERQFVAFYSMGGGATEEYYRGPMDDFDGLRDAVWGVREEILAKAVDRMTDLLRAAFAEQRKKVNW